MQVGKRGVVIVVVGVDYGSLMAVVWWRKNMEFVGNTCVF
jgi:hypothetical protein